MSLKAEKEAAVYGHKGTTLLETALIVSCMPFLLSACESKYYIEDIIGIALPLLLAETIAADYLPFGVASIPLSCLLVRRWFNSRRDAAQQERRPTIEAKSKDNYELTVLRGTTVLFTIIAILAVDFPSVFPRRYVKTEWYGAGLMDIGVGAYVFTGAIVRGSKRREMSKREIVTTLITGMMGFIRAIVNKSVDYQEHVSEYGVHWNFFVTLVAVKLFADIFSRFVARGSSLVHVIIGLAILCAHQYCLQYTVLGTWVMADADTLTRKRDSLAWQNKEGLISLPGYIALDLCTRGAADWILHLAPLQLGVMNAALWLILNLLRTYGQDIARRSANAPFVIWMFAIGTLLVMLTKAFVIPSYQRGVRSRLVTAFSKHQFLIFLIAYLLTGLVNLTFDTLHASLYESMAILSLYVCVVSFVGYVLDEILPKLGIFGGSKKQSLVKQE